MKIVSFRLKKEKKIKTDRKTAFSYNILKVKLGVSAIPMGIKTLEEGGLEWVYIAGVGPILSSPGAAAKCRGQRQLCREPLASSLCSSAHQWFHS